MRIGGRRLPKAMLKLITPAGPPRRHRRSSDGPIRARLPLPTSTNDMWAPALKNGSLTVVASRHAKQFKADVAKLLPGVLPFEGEVALRIVVHFEASDSRSDTSNRAKVLEDALQTIAYENDVQVADIHITRGEPVRPPERPYVDVEVSEWQPTAFMREELRHTRGHHLGLWR